MSKLELHWPLSTPCIIWQTFGVNGEYYRKNGIFIAGHNGLDIDAYHGQPVYASHDGFARYEVDSRQGHGVVIRSKEPALIFGKPSHYKTIYWHLCDWEKEPKYESPIPQNGEVEVKAGDLIGYADNTGFSTGDHLHFAVKPIENINGKWINSRQANGYGGCIDPSFYMSKFCAADIKKIREGVKETEEMIVHLQTVPEQHRPGLISAISDFLSALLRRLIGG